MADFIRQKEGKGDFIPLLKYRSNNLIEPWMSKEFRFIFVVTSYLYFFKKT